METTPRRAHLGRYSLWQMRDYMLNQGPATALVVALFAYIVITEARMLPGRPGAGPISAVQPQVLASLFQRLVSTLALVAAIFATNGIVSDDRRSGFYRFYFAKPVSPGRFYGALFAVRGVGVLAVSCALLAIYSWIVRPESLVRFVLAIATIYLAYGGVGFFVSTFSRYDWLSLLTALFVAEVGWGFWGDDPGVRGWLVHLLPPVHRAGEVYRFAADIQVPVPVESLIWLAGYGLVCFLLGLVVLHRRPLATSG